MSEKHIQLKKIIGKWAYNALLNGCPLQIWRRSSPHNWFIENKRRTNILWHSSDHNRILPDLRLFIKDYDSNKLICQYWGADSGQPELSYYYLIIS